MDITFTLLLLRATPALIRCHITLRLRYEYCRPRLHTLRYATGIYAEMPPLFYAMPATPLIFSHFRRWLLATIRCHIVVVFLAITPLSPPLPPYAAAAATCRLSLRR